MKSLFKKAWKNNFFQGGLFLTGANFIVGFLNYLFNIFVARAFGPAGFGDITAFFSYVVILTIPSGIITNVFILKLGKQKDAKTYSASVIQWLLEKSKNWWYFVTPVILIAPFVPQITNLSPLVGYTLIPFVILMYVSAMYDGLLQGLHVFFWVSIISIVWGIVKLTGAIVPLIGYSEISIVLFFIIAGTLVKILWSHSILKKLFIHTSQKTKKIEKRIHEIWKDKHIWLTAISGASLILLSNVDVIYVKRVFSADEAGIYNSWSLFAKIILYILGPLLSVSFIFFSSKKDEIYHKLFFIGSILFLTIAGFGAMAAYGLYGREIIELLFGSKFYPVIPFLEWASFFGTGYVLVVFMNNYFLAKASNKAYILAGSIPIYIIGLIMYGKDLGSVMLVNIWFTFGVLAIYLILFFKEKLLSLFR